ncbi:MAG: MerR family transcriptional regulator [Myxococcales bacterium]|nr:MerR family transcriptional regulator [Myxococcales bacterium]
MRLGADVAPPVAAATTSEGPVVESTSKGQLLSEADLVRIEKAHPDGLSSAQIIQIFQQRGVKLSEATFRKYVQLGLLPRCRRVGTKGKHRGSRGVYPCATVRRINSIKRLMERSYTIEEIQQSFSNFKSNIESVESALDELFKGFEREIARPQFDHAKRRTLTGDIREARQTATDLVRRLIQIESHISFPEKSQAAGGRSPSDI